MNWEIGMTKTTSLFQKTSRTTMRRILTIELEIVDQQEAEWIWKSHSEINSYNGVVVRIIEEGEKDEISVE